MDPLYADLARLARIQRARYYSKKRLGTRSIIHEAYLRLAENGTDYESEAQFLRFASVAMRNVVVDNARYWSSKKRGGASEETPLDHVKLHSAQRSEEILSLDEALTRLAKENSRMAEIITCRFFGGLTIEETAGALEISPATLKRDWTLARALLYQEMA